MSEKKYFEGTYIGQVFFLKELPLNADKRMGVFVCPNCHILYSTYLKNVTSLRSQSCGCENKNALTHGMHESDEYRAWCKMKERCCVPTSIGYERYGGAGITICDRWINSFENFFADMGKKPTPKHSIDRINNKGNYEPGNCRWATAIQQARNKSNTVYVTYEGVSKSLPDWCDDLGMEYDIVKQRLKRYGYSAKDAFTKPIKNRKLPPVSNFIPHAFGYIN